MEFTQFEVGQPFPIDVQQKEGVFLELWGDGLVLIIQFPSLNPEELAAFERGFRRYSYLETETEIPIAYWVFDYPKPFGMVDAPFNARAVRNPAYVENYLAPEEGQVKNALSVFLLDGQILKGFTLAGLLPQAVRLFQATIQKQLSLGYQQYEFARALREVQMSTSVQLFKQGRVFKHGRKKK